MSRLSVLLTTEGTYPFHKGGVSTWCDVLTRELSQIDFTLLAVTMNPFQRPCYQPAPNVRKLLVVPLWGVEHPAEYAWHAPYSVQLQRRWATTDHVIATEFVPAFERFLRGGVDHRDQLGMALLAMHEYFERFDYHVTLRSEAVWESFQRAVLAAWRTKQSEKSPDPTLGELIEALRLFYHLFLVLNVPVPEADVSHSAAAAFCGLPCVMAKLKRGTPYLLTEHGVYLREQYIGLRRQIKSRFVRWFMHRLVGAVVAVNYHYADQVSPVCAYNARWEEWWGVPRDRIKVIFNGADPKTFHPGPAVKSHRPVVSAVGMIFPLKGQLELIEAAALVRNEIPDVEFRVYGSASDEEYYAECQERVRARQLEDTVLFAGSTTTPWQTYREADVVAMASLSEAFPYTVIEAMLSGVAIVATDVGGVREALANTGILVRPRQPSELATAIVSLLRAPSERARLGSEARGRALQYFTQPAFTRAYRETYLALASGGAQSLARAG